VTLGCINIALVAKDRQETCPSGEDVCYFQASKIELGDWLIKPFFFPVSNMVPQAVSAFSIVSSAGTQLVLNTSTGALKDAHSVWATAAASYANYSPANGKIRRITFQEQIISGSLVSSPGALAAERSVHALIIQSGKYFVSSSPLGTITASQVKQNMLATFQAADFVLLSDQGQIDPNTHPDFSTGGEPIVLGLAHRNQLGNNNAAKSLKTFTSVIYWMVVIDHDRV